MGLTIEHLAAYLPYKVKVSKLHTLNSRNGIGGIEHILTTKSKEYKLHLRPLSDLTKEIEHNEEKFVPIDYLNEKYIENSSGIDTTYLLMLEHVNDYPYYIIKHLHSWHFDTFGLIEARLAIDINELNK